MRVKKIAIIGPESTGKTTLCNTLAQHFNCTWVPEYARHYLETKGTAYTFENLKEIADGQIELEQAALATLKINKINTTPILISDTNLIVIKVWSEYVFNKCDNSILSQIAFQIYDGYILCNTDVPWVKDNLREYPKITDREKLFHFYKEELAGQHTPWVIIKGNYKERTIAAIKFIEQIITK